MPNVSITPPTNLYQILETEFVRQIAGTRRTVFTGFTSQNKKDNRVLRPSLISKNGAWYFYSKDEKKVEHVRLDDFVTRYRAGSIRGVRAYYDDGTPSMITLSDMRRTAEFTKILDDIALLVNNGKNTYAESGSQSTSLSGSISNRNRKATSIEELQVQLDRRNEIGAAGERIALADEIQRLRTEGVGCPNPERYVNHIALSDVGRGYDIESTWPGYERCIEVKSSTGSGNAILISDNERTVLENLGKKAWLYRVVVDANGDGEVVLRLNDPISMIPEENFSTAVWTVHLPRADG